MINDVLPTIVIYLNRKFEIDLDKGIAAVKKSQVLKECSDNNDISMQEWLGKFLKELDLDIESDKETVKNKIDEFIQDNSAAFSK